MSYGKVIVDGLVGIVGNSQGLLCDLKNGFMIYINP